MATSRLYYQNLLTATTFDNFEVAGSAVSMAAPTLSPFYAYASGSVAVGGRFDVVTGYTAALETDYVIEIHLCPDGTFANSRWRWSDTGGTSWNQENLTPLDGVWIDLSNGVEWQFVSTVPTPQFVLGDYWYGRVLRPYGVVKAMDHSRHSDYRSGNMPATSTLILWFDLGTSVQPAFLGILDHNIPSDATISLLGDATSPALPADATQGVTWRSGHLAEFVTIGPYRYWGLRLVLGATALSYARWSEIFLGTGATLNNSPIIGATESRIMLSPLDIAGILVHGVGPQIRTTPRVTRTWALTKRDAASDGGRLDAALTYATEHSTDQQLPFWYIPRDDDLSVIELNAWADGVQRQHRFLDRWDYTVDWVQLIRRVAS
jgi:hypothetical protein